MISDNTQRRTELLNAARLAIAKVNGVKVLKTEKARQFKFSHAFY
jgi:hypothetical protein